MESRPSVGALAYSGWAIRARSCSSTRAAAMRQRGCVAWPQGKSFIGESHGGDGGAADHPSARQPACRRAAVLRTGVLRSADRGTGLAAGFLPAAFLAAAGLGGAFVVGRLPCGICARPAAKPPFAASFSASAAICWNWLVSALHHCNGSTTGCPAALDVCPAALDVRPAAPGACLWALAGSAGGGGAAGVGFAWLAPACVGSASPARSAGLGLKALATSPRLKFMPLSVARVIFCTSSACMVAASAREFCSSQNCTALSSCMRLSSSCTSIVGATQLESLGNCAMLLEAPLARLCRKSKPGTNLPKSKGGVSLMAAPREMGLWWGTAYSTALRPRRRRRAPALSVYSHPRGWPPPGRCCAPAHSTRSGFAPLWRPETPG